MSKRRIEYEAHDGSDFSKTLDLLDQYARANEVGDLPAAAGAADRVRTLARGMADDAMRAASEAGG